MKTLWSSLEALPQPEAVMAEWAELLGDNESRTVTFLADTGADATTYPCTRRPRCGCRHKVTKKQNGQIVAVCECGDCQAIPLNSGDVRLFKLVMAKILKSVAGAIKCEPGPRMVTGIVGTWQVGSFAYRGNRVPVYLTAQGDRSAYTRAIDRLALECGALFVLLLPAYNGEIYNHVHKAKGMPYSLADAIIWDTKMNQFATAKGVQISEDVNNVVGGTPVDANVATLALKLVQELDSLPIRAKPSHATVLKLYCIEGLTSNEIVKKLHCSKGTIMSRMKAIQKKLGRPLDELRDFGAILTKGLETLHHPKAKKIDPRKAIYDDGAYEDDDRE